MEDISLALCIPTYERSSIVEDFLINCSAYYIQSGIDIYYYDSSLSDKTKDVVCGWPNQNHIHYIRMDSNLDGSVKAYKIFQGYGLKKHYDFIWLSGDGVQCSKSTTEQLMANLSLKYDIIEVSGDDFNHVGTRIFTDPNEYMQKCAWHLTLFGAAVLNTHTMLNGVDWEYYEKMFLTPTLAAWSHINFYFFRILELDSFCALNLSVGPRSVKSSKLKATSGWVKTLFQIMCEGWVQTIEGLPDYYTNKKQVISNLGDFSFFKDVNQFYRYKVLGVYSLRTFLKYRAVWNKVTSISKQELFGVAVMPRLLAKMFYRLKQSMGRMKLQKFCATHKGIIVYGTGSKGDLYARCLDELGISYEAFCVSRRKLPQQENRRHPVYEFAELSGNAGDIGYIIAMEKRYVREVLPVIKKTVDGDDIFCDLRFTENLLTEDMFRAKGHFW